MPVWRTLSIYRSRKNGVRWKKKKAHKYGPVSSVIETDPVYIMQVFTKERASQYGKCAGIPWTENPESESTRAVYTSQYHLKWTVPCEWILNCYWRTSCMVPDRSFFIIRVANHSLFKEEKDSGLCLYMKCVVHSTCFIQEIRQGVLMRSTFLMRRKPF